MARSTLARHRAFGSTSPFLREGNDGGGGGSNNGGGGSGTDGGGAGGGGSGGAGSGGGSDRGYPENTPLAEMTGEQREAYHRYHSRKWQERAESRSDYDEVKADAEKWRQYQQSQQTPSEQAINEAREAGRREAATQANADMVQSLLTVAFEGRGKTSDEAKDLAAYANPAAFITDGKVDTAKVTAYAARIAGSPGEGGGNGGGGGGGGSNGGQGFQGGGRREDAPAKGVGAGKSLYAERHPQPAGAGSSNV